MEIILGSKHLIVDVSCVIDATGREHLVMVAKGTWKIPEYGQRPRPISPQPLEQSDVFVDSPENSAMLYGSDIARFKPRCDVLFNAAAHSPDGEPVKELDVVWQVGRLRKGLKAHGVRYWKKRLGIASLSAPETFIKMPLHYGMAFGGTRTYKKGWGENAATFIEVQPENPSGIGWFGPRTDNDFDGQPAPNLEALDDPVRKQQNLKTRHEQRNREMIFDEHTWNGIVKGFFIRDCTLGFENNRIGLVLVENDNTRNLDEGWETRLVAIKVDLPIKERFYMASSRGITSSSISSAWEPNQSEFVLTDTFRHVWSFKPYQYDDIEEDIPFDNKGHQFDSAIMKTVRVGNTIYALGTPFRIFRRIENQKWQDISEIPIPKAFFSKNSAKIVDAINDSMFLDLAGFAENDMYAVGDVGTVWHYDGTRWMQIAFPTNLQLNTVTCGGDGSVYITDIRGSVWKGRGSSWALLCKMDQSLPFADSAWFKGRLWCANDYGMYVLEGKNLVASHEAKHEPVPIEVALHAHRIDVSPDGSRMLVCGGQGGALHDGTKWEVIISGKDFD